MRVFEINAIADTILREVSIYNNNLKGLKDMSIIGELRSIKKDKNYKEFQSLNKRIETLKRKLNKLHGENTIVLPGVNHLKVIAIRLKNQKWTEYNKIHYINLRKQEARDLITLAALESNTDILNSIRRTVGLIK